MYYTRCQRLLHVSTGRLLLSFRDAGSYRNRRRTAAIGSVWRAPAATLVFAESHRGNYDWSYAVGNGLSCEATVLGILCSQGDLLQFRTYTSVAMAAGSSASVASAYFAWVDPA